MSLPKSRNAYQDCYELYDRALTAPAGIRFNVESEEAAIHLRMRMHTARTIDRDDNSAMHPRGAPMHGCSAYDPLQILIRADADDLWWVYIEPRAVHIIGDIEELQPYKDQPKWLEQNSPPSIGSPTGIKLLEKRSELESNAPTESSSSMPSTQPGREPMIPGLRRL
jgi:hypothetical protein